MNFLAHARLSFSDPETLAGNMISDFVKGKRKFDYPAAIQAGIQLHRQIDDFTDNHPATAQAKRLFKREYGLYSGAFVDVAFDYFLANDPSEFASEPDLADFSQQVYAQLSKQLELLPENFRRIFGYMQKQDWLLHYRNRQGIYNSFEGLVRRAAYMNNASPAVIIFDSHMPELEECYRRFFPELKMFTWNKWTSRSL